ncbi:hypothetical protein ACFQLX_07400 [Streptomyces polyrhachis]|uniref:DUF4190 domain-containing protein n=1 Tax=Streptomyces polyrhachis TaxID=1282885 RepID=A0ABW2GDN3_9ACTN
MQPPADPPPAVNRPCSPLGWGVAAIAVWLFPFWLLSSVVSLALGIIGLLQGALTYRKSTDSSVWHRRFVVGISLSALATIAAIAYWEYLIAHPELLEVVQD